MTRTFHHRITIGEICGIILFLLLSVYAFWIKCIIMGLAMVLLLIIVSERALHTEYIIGDGRLVIDKGRLSKPKEIMLDDIESCRPMATVFGLVSFLLITYGKGNKMVSVHPANPQSFIRSLKTWKEADDYED